MNITVLRVKPVKDAKGNAGYEVFDVNTGEKFDAEKEGLRHIMMHLAYQAGQYVYRHGKKWRRGAADSKIFATYNVTRTPIEKPAKKGAKNVATPVTTEAPAEVKAPEMGEAPVA